MKQVAALYTFALEGTQGALPFNSEKFIYDPEYKGYVLHCMASVVTDIPTSILSTAEKDSATGSKYALELAETLILGDNFESSINKSDDQESSASVWELHATHARCMLLQSVFNSDEYVGLDIPFIVRVMQLDRSGGDMFMRNVIVPALDNVIARHGRTTPENGAPDGM